MPRGRQRGARDKRPRLTPTRRLELEARIEARGGSESSRILQRRLEIQAAGGGMSVGEQRTLTPYALNEFEREQVARVRRLLARSESRVRAARGQAQREDERASRNEVIVSFDVQVRGSCGSDVHVRQS